MFLYFRFTVHRSVIIQYGEDMLTLAVDPETNQPSAFAGDENGDKLFLPEFVYGLSIERIADYIIVKVIHVTCYNTAHCATKIVL